MPRKPPKAYLTLKKRHPDLLRAVEALGEAARKAGPLDDKTAHLIQLAAATFLLRYCDESLPVSGCL